MTYNNLPNVVFEALAPEKLDRMIEAALATPQVTTPAKPSNVVAFPGTAVRAAWFTGTGALAASLFLAITLMPTPGEHGNVIAEEPNLNDLFAYQTLSR
jgi:hypothetical protein